MNAKTVAAVAACLVAAAGCIFSPDDDAPKRTADVWQPELYVTPDSVYAWFPFDWPDSTTWTWNGAREGAWEYIMEASVETIGPKTRSTAVHIAFVVESDGSGARTGTFQELAQSAEGNVWITDAFNRGVLWGAYPLASVRLMETGVEVTAWRGLTDFVYLSLPDRGPWIATFDRRGAFDRKTVTRPAHYVYDVAQDRARAVLGPLEADDYAVMDVVASNYERYFGGPVVVVSPTHTYTHDNEYNAIQALRADEDTESAFIATRTREADLRALSQVGYTVADEHAIPPGYRVRMSRIGYNRERTQAMLYGSYYCGLLCAEGEIILLRKLRGYWVIEGRIMLWIS